MRARCANRRVLQLLTGCACLVLAAGLGVALDGVWGDVQVDRLARRLVGPPFPVSGPVAIWMAHLADRGPTAAALAVVAVVAVLRPQGLRPAVAVVASAALVQLLAVLGKSLVDRTLYGSGPAYPSGHVAGATAVLALAVLVAGRASRRARWAVAGAVGLLPVAAALGALWTQSHVMTDVVGGALVGGGAALVVWSILVPPLGGRNSVDLAGEQLGVAAVQGHQLGGGASVGDAIVVELGRPDLSSPPTPPPSGS